MTLSEFLEWLTDEQGMDLSGDSRDGARKIMLQIPDQEPPIQQFELSVDQDGDILISF
jgi:hypothetical protein